MCKYAYIYITFFICINKFVIIYDLLITAEISEKCHRSFLFSSPPFVLFNN